MCQIHNATQNSSSINTAQAARQLESYILEPLKSDSPLTLAPDFNFQGEAEGPLRAHFVGTLHRAGAACHGQWKP